MKMVSMRRTVLSPLACAALGLLATQARAQVIPVSDAQVRAAEDSLQSSVWRSRDAAVYRLSLHPDRISSVGIGRLIALLEREMDGSAPPPPPTVDEEAYPQYVQRLTNLVERYNDPRATPLLARQGIAFSMNSRFQVAAAGDVAMPHLRAAWNENANLRPAVIHTVGLAIRWADSLDRPLSPDNRRAALEMMLRGYASVDVSERRAFVTAAEVARLGTITELVRHLATTDSTMLEGARFVARAAEALLPALTAQRSSSTDAQLTAELVTMTGAVCEIGWISDEALCQALRSAFAGGTAGIGIAQQAVRQSQSTNADARRLLGANADFVARRNTTTSGIVLTYICGNRFRVRNPNPYVVPMRYDVYGTSEASSIELPPRQPGTSFSETFFSTTHQGTVRLYFGEILVQTKANGGKATCP